jgi:DtxR family Mn-dependent transcriptional regulator
MAHPKTPTTEISENREMYLIRIAGLLEDGQASPVSLHLLADELEIMPVSVNEMVRKLDEEGLVRYIPYKGVELLPEGEAIARSVLRRRRLWEVFLVRELGLSPMEADALACRMEHITPSDVADRLDEFLDNPAQNPQGKAIPPGGEAMARSPDLRLSEAGMAEAVEVVGVASRGAEADFLREEGIRPGALLRVVGVGASGDLLLDTESGRVRLSREVVEAISVKRAPDLEGES